MWSVGSAALSRYSLRGKLRRINVHQEGAGLDLKQWVTVKIRWAFQAMQDKVRSIVRRSRSRSRSRGPVQRRGWW